MSFEFDMERLSCESDTESPVCPSAPTVKPLSYAYEQDDSSDESIT